VVDVEHMGVSILADKTGQPLDANKDAEGWTEYKIGTPRLSIADYQLLMDRGWRRRGHKLVKVGSGSSCSTAHSVRVDLKEF